VFSWLSVGTALSFLPLPNYGNEIQNLEIMHLCEVGSLSESKIERQYGLTSLTLFTILKNSATYFVISVCNCVMNMAK
jgi:hypothetical protein